MNRTNTLFLILSLIPLISAISGNEESFRLKTSTPHFFSSHRNGWKILSDLPNGNQVERFSIALKERNLKVAEQLALAIADPDSPTYGQHLSFEEMKELVAPLPQNVEKVEKWLKQIPCSYFVEPAGGHITFTATLKSVEKLLGTSFRSFYNQIGNRTIFRSEKPYYVPKELDGIVDFVAGVHGFPLANKAKSIFHQRRSELKDEVEEVTPTIIRQRYNITVSAAPSKVNNSQSVLELGEGIYESDLASFFQQFAPKLSNQKVLRFIGSKLDEADTEASLDIQYIMAIGAFAPSYYYNYMESDVYKAFYHFAMDLINDPKPPLVHSISYGQYGGKYPLKEVDRISYEFMKLGMRGVTILVASGDDGVGCNDAGTKFEFPYPSTPYVTFLGSTHLKQDDNSLYYETGATFSSGGFSNDFGMPPWQSKFVNDYLKTPNLPVSFFNASGRALPDLSTVGVSFQVVVDGEVNSVDGTSCSAPTFAGMVSLFNGERLKAGKKPMGFLNPFLYKAATNFKNAYYDVTEGNNAYGDCPGFDAVKGWDPVTGLGTPNFQVLLKYALSL